MKLRWLFLVLNLFLVIGLIFLIKNRDALIQNASPAGLPSYGAAPGFSLTERSGSRVSLSDLNGKVWVATFIFTRCAGQCPLMSRAMSRFQSQVKDLRLVSFSVDPDYDTPAVLADYAKNYQADPNRWLFLTGDKETLNEVAKGFHVTGLGDPMFHSVSFALVDQKGQIRGYYDSNDTEKMKQLYRDIHLLLKQ